MELGIIGLGKMGFNMAERLRLAGQKTINVSAPVIAESLIRRLRSREDNNVTDRMLAVMRNEFGGHAVKKA